jgi:predicted dehydrogenase
MSKNKIKGRISRREFLASSAAVGAGLVLSSTVTSLADNGRDSEDIINVALIGAGAQGRVLLEAAVKIPGIRFVALCDIWTEYNQKNQSRFLDAYGHKHNNYEYFREMLDKEKDLDAVIIATPDFCHSEQAVACLEAGLDVYCEKEMSNTLEGARKIIEASNRTGKLLQIGHQRRSNPRYIYCYEKILKEAGLLRQITTVNGQWNRSKQACLDRDIPEKYYINQSVLEKFGFESMHQFLNWRWFKELGGGPIVDLGSHQIDIYNWFLETNPKSVMASGGTDYYEKNTHQWYDNVVAVYEYQTKQGIVRAFYQTGTTNSSQGYFESFMGDEATLVISEASNRGSIYREAWVKAEKWDKWVANGMLYKQSDHELKCIEEAKKQCRLNFGSAIVSNKANGAIVDVRESPTPPKYDLPITMDELYHQPHLENFFNAIRGKEKLNCPAEIGYETAVTVLKVNEAIAAGQKLEFKPEEFKVL